MKYETLKNPIFILTSSFVATQIFMLIISASGGALVYNLYSAFWDWDSGNWSFTILSGIWLVVACVTLTLTIFFGIKEWMPLSYGFGAAAGVLLAFLIFNLMVVMGD